MFVGVEIGGTKLQLVLGGSDGRILRRERRLVDLAQGAEGIRKQIQEGFKALVGSEKIEGVGVGFGGPVDWRTGKLCCSHQVEGWTDFQLGAWLKGLTGTVVRVENDANTAALGEGLIGAGMGKSPVFYVTLGSGVGGGMVLDGKIYHGKFPGEMEIGHTRLDKSGVIFEDRCAGWAVDKKIRQAIKKEGGVLAALCAGQTRGEARFLRQALAQNDAVAKRILTETADDLGFGLSHVVHLCHPEVIVIGGGLSLVGEPLRVEVESALKKYVMDVFQPGPEVKLAALGEDSVPCGALLLAATS